MASFLDLKVLKEYVIVGLVSFNCEIELKISFLLGFIDLELNSAGFIEQISIFIFKWLDIFVAFFKPLVESLNLFL